MDRMAKAAIATSGAVVLLVFGVGTAARWENQASFSISPVVTGGLAAGSSTCSNWLYASGQYSSPTPSPVTSTIPIVPGDTVESTCNLTFSGTGDHLVVTAETSTTSASLTGQLAANVQLTIGTPSLLSGSGAVVNSDGTIDLSGTGGSPVTVSVVITMVFPYGTYNAATPSAGAHDGSESLSAVLSSVVVDVTQVQTATNPIGSPSPSST